MTEKIELKEYEEQKYCLLFEIRKSIRYHTQRKRFFDWLHNTTTFLCAVSGTATIATILGKFDQSVSISFALCVTVFSMIDLVIGSPRAARLYDDLARRFIALEKQLMLSEKSLAALDAVTLQRLNIEAEEPPVLRVLNAVCYNEVTASLGYSRDKFIRITWFQHLFRHIMDLMPNSLSLEGSK